MVALADWRMTLIFLQLEKLSSPSRSDPEGRLLLVARIAAQMDMVHIIWYSLFQSNSNRNMASSMSKRGSMGYGEMRIH